MSCSKEGFAVTTITRKWIILLSWESLASRPDDVPSICLPGRRRIARVGAVEMIGAGDDGFTHFSSRLTALLIPMLRVVGGRAPGSPGVAGFFTPVCNRFLEPLAVAVTTTDTLVLRCVACGTFRFRTRSAHTMACTKIFEVTQCGDERLSRSSFGLKLAHFCQIPRVEGWDL